MHRRVAWFLAVSAVVVSARPGAARAERELGSYEQQALDLALARTGLLIDPAPAGKVLRRIHVVNLDVFSPEDGGLLQFFNVFHRTTREHVVRREALLEPGQVWDPEIAEETERKLRDPIFSTLAIVVPVQVMPGDPSINPAAQVDMLIVTRDVWSLRLNSDFEFQQDKLTFLLLAPSENNFLGLRKLAAVVFNMNQGDYAIGPLYLDKNVLGKRLELSARADAIFRRADSALEGERLQLVLERPFWSLASRWGGLVSVFHEDRVTRSFLGTELREYTVPDVDDVGAPIPCAGSTAPFEFGRRRLNVQYAGSHQLGQRHKHRFSVGHRIQRLESSFADGFPTDPCLRDNFEADVFLRSERVSELFVQYTLFRPQFAKLRNIDTFDLPEDVRFGPSLTAEFAVALGPLGSEDTFPSAELEASWTAPWSPGGLARISAGTSARLQDDEIIDHIVQVSAQVVSPMVAGTFRLVGQLELHGITRDRNNNFFTLGGDNGLRGFGIGAFSSIPRADETDPTAGETDLRVRGNFELRTAPLALGFTRFGGLVFVDVGGVDYALDRFQLHTDAGVGLRLLLPQLSPLVYRLDWAVPLEGGVLPGRVIFAAGQAF